MDKSHVNCLECEENFFLVVFIILLFSFWFLVYTVLIGNEPKKKLWNKNLLKRKVVNNDFVFSMMDVTRALSTLNLMFFFFILKLICNKFMVFRLVGNLITICTSSLTITERPSSTYRFFPIFFFKINYRCNVWRKININKIEKYWICSYSIKSKKKKLWKEKQSIFIFR